MNQIVQDAINKQISTEFAASFSYLAMSTYCERENFTGCAKWLRAQSLEEYGHAMRLLNFLLARNYKVEMQAIPAPKSDYTSVVDVFTTALQQEQEVSRQIDALYELAFKEKSFASLVELQWFITEQVEEEKTAREIVAKFTMVKDDPASLLDLDRDLGGRAPESGGAEGESE